MIFNQAKTLTQGPAHIYRISHFNQWFHHLLLDLLHQTGLNLMVCSITYTGPLMMSAIIMFISAMYSCRSGCGRSSSEELIDKKKTF